MAKSVAYQLTHDAALTRQHWTLKAFFNKEEVARPAVKSKELTAEDMHIVTALNEAASDMAYIHSCFDHITEDVLIDCLIYELKAVSLRHKFLLDLCKAKGIVGGSPVA